MAGKHYLPALPAVLALPALMASQASLASQALQTLLAMQALPASLSTLGILARRRAPVRAPCFVDISNASRNRILPGCVVAFRQNATIGARSPAGNAGKEAP